MGEVDLNKVEPWDLPWKAKTGEKEWHFFCLKDRKYPTGLRFNRATSTGNQFVFSVLQNEWVVCKVFNKTLGQKKVHISEMLSCVESSLDLPPLVDFSSGENTRHTNAAVHVTCFSNLIQDNQDISVEEYTSSSNTNLVYPATTFSSQPTPCTENFHFPDSDLKQEPISGVEQIAHTT
ncbi:hypothetical protein SASPL_117493 [Salvia splendens]|uniref:NAC domain-containing protein n=1 Tax=Salvia splendens TaxID=180675 RepID=A0A8X8ZWC4_SALSN|nr:hypothetical protein SASPL_117493 [Salvia splendens]